MLRSAVAASVITSVIGWVLLPADARVLHHSSGATWTRDVAVLAYPAVVAGIAAVVFLVTRSEDGNPRDRWIGGGGLWLVVAFQAGAFIAAG